MLRQEVRAGLGDEHGLGWHLRGVRDHQHAVFGVRVLSQVLHGDGVQRDLGTFMGINIFKPNKN